MRSVERTIAVRAPARRVFARLAAFEGCADWDPGVAAARRLDDGPPAVGARFEVHARFAGRVLPMVYTLVQLEPDRRLVFDGRAAGSRVRDTIEIDPDGAGARIRWRLDVRLLGWRRLGEPLLGPLLRRLADAAMAGLAADVGR